MNKRISDMKKLLQTCHEKKIDSCMERLVDNEKSEDYAKLAGLTAEEDRTEPTLQSVKKRLPWLMILLALGTLVSSVVGIFEGIAAILPILICFQSLVLDMAGYEWYGAFSVSGCVGISLLIAMTVSSLVGTIIPMFFHKINVDPAVASGPLITTVNDLVAVISYYGLAYFILIR